MPLPSACGQGGVLPWRRAQKAQNERAGSAEAHNLGIILCKKARLLPAIIAQKTNLTDQNITTISSNSKDLIELDQEMGALWGRGRSGANSDIAKLEEKVLSDWKDWCYALEHSGLSQQRRNLIVRPNQLSFEKIAEGNWRFKFSLPKGSFATAILREIAELSRSTEHHL